MRDCVRRKSSAGRVWFAATGVFGPLSRHPLLSLGAIDAAVWKCRRYSSQSVRKLDRRNAQTGACRVSRRNAMRARVTFSRALGGRLDLNEFKSSSVRLRIQRWSLTGSASERTRLLRHDPPEGPVPKGRASSSHELTTMTRKNLPEARSPLTPAGIANYMGLLSVHDISVTGTLPKGNTTRTVTHFITDMANNSIVGHVILPDAAQENNSVSMTVKVPNASTSLAIGTFESDGFHPTTFLSVGTPTNRGARGT